ncbi:MAG: hypothetical protein KC776_13825 [Myxococcales bacterium]|nr:hypothetical protein [Myxococcales bacterium]
MRPFLVRLALGLGALGILFPSRIVHGDAYDELASYELARPVFEYRHPIAEPLLWALTHAARALHLAERSLRPTQWWNAVWVIVALGLVFVYGERVTRSRPAAVGATLLLAACHVTLFWLRDPFLPYWAPSLAFLTAMLLSERPRFIVLFGALATLMNPMLMPAVVAVAVMRSNASLTRAVGLAWFALVPVLVVELLFAPVGVTGFGVYGVWRPHALARALGGFRAALLAAPTEASSWMVLAALALLTVLAAKPLRHWKRSVPLLVACAAHAVFVAWWDPEQFHFWMLVPWLLVLAWLTAFDPEAKIDPWLARAAALAISLLAARNALGYVWPTTRGEDPELARAERARTAFGDSDLLVFPDWPDLALGYWAQRQTTGWVSLFAERQPGEGTFSVFERSAEQVRHSGGRVFLDVDERGAPRITDDPDVGVSRAERERLVLGNTQLLGSDRLREVRGVLPRPVCSSRREALPLWPGASVLASGFVESRSYAPERAFDGDRRTEWLTRGDLGWIEVYLDPPRRIATLAVTNVRNAPFDDYATRVASLTTAFSSGESEEKRLVFPRDGGDLLRVPLNARNVRCVRFLVLEHAGQGGGIAEMSMTSGP